MKRALSVGDRVLWSGEWGRKSPKPATVTRIEFVEPGEKYGRPVMSIPWEDVPYHAVVDLDTGAWAYGDQIKPISKIVWKDAGGA